eukprot:9240949-Pyramimonas_sp.AAC.1
MAVHVRGSPNLRGAYLRAAAEVLEATGVEGGSRLDGGRNILGELNAPGAAVIRATLPAHDVPASTQGQPMRGAVANVGESAGVARREGECPPLAPRVRETSQLVDVRVMLEKTQQRAP